MKFVLAVVAAAVLLLTLVVFLRGAPGAGGPENPTPAAVPAASAPASPVLETDAGGAARKPTAVAAAAPELSVEAGTSRAPAPDEGLEFSGDMSSSAAAATLEGERPLEYAGYATKYGPMSQPEREMALQDLERILTRQKQGELDKGERLSDRAMAALSREIQWLRENQAP